MKKILTILLWIIVGIILFVLLWIGAAFLLPKIKLNKDFVACSSSDQVVIYLRSNGMHTDMVFDVQNTIRHWSKLFPVEAFEGVDSTFNYIAVGWGDKGFYLDTPTWAQVKLSTILKATIGASGSAMHITYLASHPHIDNKYVKRLSITPEQYRKLLDYIDQAFVRDDQNGVILIQHPDYDTNDNYYEAKGSYSVFKTCNIWTNRCLKSAGIQNGLWTPTAAGVISSLP